MIDETSIRDGMLYTLAGLSSSESLDALDGEEAMRGHALSCSLFSCIAIGGLTLGYPNDAVARHIAAAKASLDKFEGLSGRFAASALLLYALVHLLLRRGKADGEYHTYERRSRAAFEALPERDPVLSSLFTYRTLYDGLHVLDMEMAYSRDPLKFVREKLSVPEDLGASTPVGEAIVHLAETGTTDPGGGGVSRKLLERGFATQAAHPACVVTDGKWRALPSRTGSVMHVPTRGLESAGALNIDAPCASMLPCFHASHASVAYRTSSTARPPEMSSRV